MPKGLRLLGGFAVADEDGLLLPLRLDRPSSLLVYLAVRGEWVGRRELAFLYRPEEDEAVALAYLRKLVFRARRFDWAHGLELGPDALQWKAASDVVQFRAAIAGQEWETALSLYRGQLLEAAELTNAPGFAGWLEAERGSLEAAWMRAATSRAAELEERGRLDEAAELHRLILRKEPLAEETVMRHMRVLADLGRRREALAAFERFRLELELELDTVPLETTQALADELRRTGVRSNGDGRVLPPVQLPQPTTTFVGREAELQRLTQLLADGETRLLSIVGLGGSGKTRLAIEAGRRRSEEGAEVAFVSLAAAQHADQMAPTITEALHIPWEAGDAQAALVKGVQDRQLLLILDNFEGVVDAAGQLTQLLEMAPGLTVLVTSREALRTAGEYLIDLEGMATPEPDEHTRLDSYDAVRLFVQRAVRIAPDFAPSARDLRTIAGICRDLAGLPLAIELVASWCRLLRPEELRQQLMVSEHLLTSRLRDIAPRHRNLWRILDYTWSRLEPAEQAALTRLTVFRGGFTLEAALMVAGADLEILLGLMDRTLIRRRREGRFGVHELVRQFVRGLETWQMNKESAEEAHSSYYCSQLGQIAEILKQGKVQSALSRIQEDLRNFELAWEQAVRRYDYSAIEKAAFSLDNYFYYRGRFATGATTFAKAARVLGEHSSSEEGNEAERLQGRLMLSQAEHERNRGNVAAAQEVANQALARLHRSGKPVDIAYGKLGVASGLIRLARYARAKELLEEVLDVARSAADPYLEGAICNGLANVVIYTGGSPDDAEEFYRASLRAHRLAGNLEGVNGALINLGACRFDLHDFDEAEGLWLEAARISSDLGYRQREAVVLNNLGSLAQARGDLQKARLNFEKSLRLRRDIGDRPGEASTLNCLGRLALEQNDLRQAREHLQNSLELFGTLGDDAGVAHTRSALARTLIQTGQLARAQTEIATALQLAVAIGSHPDVLGCLLTLALLRESQGERSAALRIASEVVRRAAERAELIREEAQALVIRLGGADLIPGQATEAGGEAPACESDDISLYANEELTRLGAVGTD